MGTERINPYSMKPKAWFFSKETFSGQRSNSNRSLYMGIELEMEFPAVDAGGYLGSEAYFQEKSRVYGEICDELHDYSNDEKYFYLKSDGSLNNGCEIVSHPMTLWFHRQFTWEMILEYLDEAGCKSHDTETCGLHVHVNKSFFDDRDKVNLGIFVNSQEKNMVALARRSSWYAKFKKIDETTKAADMVNNVDRYEAVNWLNSKTIEFRLFKGTLSYPTLIATLELVDAVCRFSKTVSGTEMLQVDIAWRSFEAYIAKFPRKFVLLNRYMRKRGI